METGTLIQLIEIISMLGGFAGLLIYIGKLLQRIQTGEERAAELEAKVQTLETGVQESKSSLGGVRSDVDEMRGSLRELDVLKSLPAQIGHVSTQVDKIAGAMEKMNSEVQSLQTLSQLKNQMLGLLEEARKDHETRMRVVEAHIRDKR